MKTCIVNVSVGHEDSWYHKGSQRLFNSLRVAGYEGEILYRKVFPPFKYESAYAHKVMAIYEAAQKGYDLILYLDCSITALRPLQDIWEHIEEHGYYLYKTGYNCANTATDLLLNTHGISRDLAENWTEAATNVIGIDCRTEKGKKLIQMMADSVSNGSIYGEKFPNEQQRLAMSKDPRFMFCRQDQSVISIAANILEMPIISELNHFVFRWEDQREMNKSVIFKLKGGE